MFQFSSPISKDHFGDVNEMHMLSTSNRFPLWLRQWCDHLYHWSANVSRLLREAKFLSDRWNCLLLHRRSRHWRSSRVVVGGYVGSQEDRLHWRVHLSIWMCTSGRRSHYCDVDCRSFHRWYCRWSPVCYCAYVLCKLLWVVK